MRCFFHLPPIVSKGIPNTASCKNRSERKNTRPYALRLYGPNASGKTSIIGAMDTFKSIVLRGHIRNVIQQGSPNAVARLLELIPNNSLQTSEPVTFGIKFITDNLFVEYSFSADLGKFLYAKYHRRVLSETLKINGSVIFERGDGLQFDNLKDLKLPTPFDVLKLEKLIL